MTKTAPGPDPNASRISDCSVRGDPCGDSQGPRLARNGRQLAAMIAYLAPRIRAACSARTPRIRRPALMGWNELPGGKAVFAVCADCGAGPEAEQRICAKIGFRPLAHVGSA